MNINKTIRLTSLSLLVAVAIPGGCVVQAYRHERANHDLISAINASNTDSALAALKAGADPNTRDRSDHEALTLVGRIKKILNDALHRNPAPQDGERDTPLLLELNINRKDNPTLVSALLKSGADPNLTGSPYAAAPLMWEVDGHHPMSLRLLLDHGASLEQQDKDGWTALHWAARHGSVESIIVLLDAGADINALNTKRETPLYVACDFENSAAAKALLDRHADPNLRTYRAETPLDWAIRYNKPRFVELLRNGGGKTVKELDAESKSYHKP